MQQSAKKRISRTLNITLQCFITILTFFPMYFMLITSFKSNEQILADYFGIVFPLHFHNYAAAFSRVMYYLYNSTVVCVAAVIGVSVLSAVSAYVFARYEFYGKKVLFLFILSFMMIPATLTMIPQFILIVNLKMIGTKLALILPYIAFGQILFIYVLRTFIEEIPKDLFDSAKIDGASDLMMFFNIVLPIAKPMITSLALLNFLTNWNDFAWPLLVLPKETSKTIAVGLYAFTSIQHIQYGLLFAGFVIASLPPLVLLTANMKYFIQGVTSGAIKA